MLLRAARLFALLPFLVAAACRIGVLPLSASEVITVKTAVETCNRASGIVGPFLKFPDTLGAQKAANDAHFTCSKQLEIISRLVADRADLRVCHSAIDLQISAMSKELDGQDPENQKAFVDEINQAIIDARQCGPALDRAAARS